MEYIEIIGGIVFSVCCVAFIIFVFESCNIVMNESDYTVLEDSETNTVQVYILNKSSKEISKSRRNEILCEVRYANKGKEVFFIN